MKNLRLVLAATLVATIGLMAFTPITENSAASTKVEIQKGGEENNYNFIKTNIINKIVEQKDPKQLKAEMFSRCPSGYRHRFAEGYNSESRIAEGKIINYKGCQGVDVCKFKIDMDKGIAMVSNLEEDNFVSVDTWLLDDEKAQNQSTYKK